VGRDKPALRGGSIMGTQMIGDLTFWELVMKRMSVVLVGCAVLLLIAPPLYGQTGCTDSPENPTVVLALAGGAGALFSAVRSRLRARRNSSQR
jgi:XrtJ-associated TM-motif-TM protein